MNTKDIIGWDSAVKEASWASKVPRNIQISNQLILDIDKRLAELEQQNRELAAHVERLRGRILSLQVTDDGVTGKGYNKGLLDSIGVLESQTPQQSLAEHDNALIDKVVNRIFDCREMELSQGDKDTIILITKRIKDGE